MIINAECGTVQYFSTELNYLSLFLPALVELSQQLLHPSVMPRHVDRRSPPFYCTTELFVDLEACIVDKRLVHSIMTVHECRGGGRGLNCEAKAQVLFMPPSLFFLEVGRKMVGVTAGHYGMSEQNR